MRVIIAGGGIRGLATALADFTSSAADLVAGSL